MQRGTNTSPITRPTAPGSRVESLSGGKMTPNLAVPVLGQVAIYRPRGALVVLLLVFPAFILLGLMLAGIIAGMHGEVAQTLFITAGGLGLCWALAFVMLQHFTLLRVRTQGDRLVVSFALGGERRMQWSLIDRVERRFGLLRVHASNGVSLSFYAGGLEDGQKLARQVVLRVSPGVLSAPLQRELALMGGATFAANPDEELSLNIAPQWLIAAGVVALAGTGLATWGSLTHIIWLFILGVVIGLFGAFLLLSLRQRIVLQSGGLTIIRGLGGRRSLKWDEISLIKALPLEMRLALRGKQRYTCIGPFFMSPLHRDRLRDALQSNVLARGGQLLVNWWLF